MQKNHQFAPCKCIKLKDSSDRTKGNVLQVNFLLLHKATLKQLYQRVNPFFRQVHGCCNTKLTEQKPHKLNQHKFSRYNLQHLANRKSFEKPTQTFYDLLTMTSIIIVVEVYPEVSTVQSEALYTSQHGFVTVANSDRIFRSEYAQGVHVCIVCFSMGESRRFLR